MMVWCVPSCLVFTEVPSYCFITEAVVVRLVHIQQSQILRHLRQMPWFVHMAESTAPPLRYPAEIRRWCRCFERGHFGVFTPHFLCRICDLDYVNTTSIRKACVSIPTVGLGNCLSSCMTSHSLWRSRIVDVKL